ncbi:hypothetical protein B0H10DRAFT_2207457 [Mycena sp. CBHHK59/15]|nr:hypothetical protein B0H10DRAFT_2207457 [Mycena sp. CBHHK59/15]
MSSKESADWTTNPEDLTHLLEILHDKKGRIGDGGNFDKTAMNETAVKMATKWPPKKGGPKTAKTRKLYEYILQAKQKAYLGVSGWMYSNELGFNVMDDDRDTWSNFTKAHPHFKPFAMCGWAHFKTVDEIVPSRALGHYVFSPGTTQASDDATPQSQEMPQEPSQLSQGSD